METYRCWEPCSVNHLIPNVSTFVDITCALVLRQQKVEMPWLTLGGPILLHK